MPCGFSGSVISPRTRIHFALRPFSSLFSIRHAEFGLKFLLDSFQLCLILDALLVRFFLNSPRLVDAVHDRAPRRFQSVRLDGAARGQARRHGLPLSMASKP